MSTDKRPGLAILLPFVTAPLLCTIATVANGMALEVFKYQDNWRSNGLPLLAAAIIDIALVTGAVYYRRPRS